MCEEIAITFVGTLYFRAVWGSNSCTFTSHRANCFLRAYLNYRQIFITASCVLQLR